jgi:class 3 adenylate cyclase
MPYIATTPLAALLLTDRRWTAVWTLASVGTAVFFTAMAIRQYPLPKGIPADWVTYYHGNGLIWLVLLCLFLCLVFKGDLTRTNKKLEAERQKSDDLLRNILPEETMQELKATGKTSARSYAQVTVLFADFKDFTIFSEELDAETLVQSIDEYFEAFDRIVARHDVEKIKTVGDAYICASGLPEANDDNACIIVSVGLEMLRAVHEIGERRRDLGLHAFEVRIGIHSGPLVAGVVGIKKFAYDIWGDTVNTAARMQQSGEPDRVNISGATYDLVKADYKCTHRGKIDAKHKGAVDMYFVEKEALESLG